MKPDVCVEFNSGGTVRTMTIGDDVYKLPGQHIDDLIRALQAIRDTNFCTARVFLQPLTDKQKNLISG